MMSEINLGRIIHTCWLRSPSLQVVTSTLEHRGGGSTSYPNHIMLTALRKKVQKCTEVGETFECRGPHKAQINCSEYVSLPDLLQ